MSLFAPTSGRRARRRFRLTWVRTQPRHAAPAGARHAKPREQS